MSQEDVEVPRLLFEAFDRGDRATFARVLARTSSGIPSRDHF
jgi:hypothetical protein